MYIFNNNEDVLTRSQNKSQTEGLWADFSPTGPLSSELQVHEGHWTLQNTADLSK